ncbi:MAG: DUF3291 domain-containing protein [Chloroflexi bacterium]|nr:DUF3291 domain-containing protein [Chloroflexota bacterium]
MSIDTTGPTHHIAQLNIGILRADRDDPMIAEFMAALDPINAIADASPGFVWRLVTPEGNATSIRPFDDDRILVNMSVWESLETLEAFTYRSAHTQYIGRRREWFQRFEGRFMVLWGVPAGHIPDIEEAKARLTLLERDGPTPEAFTYRHPFPQPGIGIADPAQRP